MPITRRKSIKMFSIIASMALLGGCTNNGSYNADINLEDDDNGMINHDSRTITLNLSKKVEQNSFADSIELHDKDGSLYNFYTIELDNATNTSKVTIKLNDSFKLNHAWKYVIYISDKLQTQEHTSFSTSKIEFATKAHSSLDNDYLSNPSTQTTRTKTIVISDLHIGGDDAIDKAYSWTIKNIDTIVSFLKNLKTNISIKELIIAGDLLDGWMIPYDDDPAPDGTLAFFQMIRNSRGYITNDGNSVKTIFDTLNDIADEGDIQVHYLNGNHDMLITKDMFNDLSMFPNIIWHSDCDGLGAYWPQSDVVIEHGHRYDFSCAPDNISNSESILPYGYFISRLYTKNKLEEQGLVQAIDFDLKTLEFETLWNTGTLESGGKFFGPNPELVKMGEIKGWNDIVYDDAKKTFLSSGDKWEERQIKNKVLSPLGILESSVMPLVNIVPGYIVGTMAEIAAQEYFENSRANIVVFGHTHHAEVVKNLLTLNKIYANSGTWIDKANNSNKDTCTYVELDLIQDTDSEVNIVTSYIYNKNTNPTLIATQYI